MEHECCNSHKLKFASIIIIITTTTNLNIKFPKIMNKSHFNHAKSINPQDKDFGRAWKKLIINYKRDRKFIWFFLRLLFLFF